MSHFTCVSFHMCPISHLSHFSCVPFLMCPIQSLDIIGSVHHLRSSVHSKIAILSNALLNLLNHPAKTLSDLTDLIEITFTDFNKDCDNSFTPKRFISLIHSSRVNQLNQMTQLNSETSSDVTCHSQLEPTETLIHIDPYITQFTLMATPDLPETNSSEVPSGEDIWSHLKSFRGPAASHHHMSHSLWNTSTALFIHPPDCLPRGSDAGAFVCSRNAQRNYFGAAGLIKNQTEQMKYEFDFLCLFLLSCDAIARQDSAKLTALSLLHPQLPNVGFPSKESQSREIQNEQDVSQWMQICEFLGKISLIFNSTENRESRIQDLSNRWSLVVQSLDIPTGYNDISPRAFRLLFARCLSTVEILLLLSIFTAVVVSPTKSLDGHSSIRIPKQALKKWVTSLSSSLEVVSSSFQKLSKCFDSEITDIELKVRANSDGKEFPARSEVSVNFDSQNPSEVYENLSDIFEVSP